MKWGRRAKQLGRFPLCGTTAAQLLLNSVDLLCGTTVAEINTRGVDSHMKQTGMLVENFEFNP